MRDLMQVIRHLRIAFIPLLLLLNLPALAQTDSNSEFDLAGVVVNENTGEPIARALVQYTGFEHFRRGAPPPAMRFGETFTDSSGGFRFTGLPAGTYNLIFNRPQFLVKTTNVQLDANTKELHIALSRLGVISGTVTDSDGTPLRTVNVILYQLRMVNGRRNLTQSRTVSTDDLGQYRLWNLSAGTYLLKAAGRGTGATGVYTADNLPNFSERQCFTPVYLGGGTDSRSSTPIDLRSGQEVTGDFHLSLQPARKIRGTLTGVAQFRNAKFELISPNGESVSTRAALSASGGRFELLDVPPGAYTVRVTQGTGNDEVFGEAAANVQTADAENVNIAARPGANIEVISHCPAQPETAPEIKTFEGSLYDGRNCAAPALIGPNGRVFRPAGPKGFQNVPPGDYDIEVLNFSTGYATSIQASGQALRPNQKLTVRDAMGPIEISLSNDFGSLQASLDFPPSQKADDIQVLVVPQFESFMVPTHMPPNAPMPFFQPGDYTLYALHQPDLETLEYSNPEALRLLTPSATVRVDPHGVHKVQLKGLAK